MAAENACVSNTGYGRGRAELADGGASDVTEAPPALAQPESSAAVAAIVKEESSRAAEDIDRYG